MKESSGRRDSIKELIDTERAYVDDLSIVSKVFEIPLRESRILSNKDIASIFLNWEEIYKCNDNFLADLTRKDVELIGSIIQKHLPLFTPYISFCTNELESANLLQKLVENSTAFKNFMKKCQLNPLVKGMPLSSFLIKPMQRITKYPLLITKILEHTDETNEDYKSLKKALEVAEEFLNCINENMVLKENRDRMDWLQKYVQNEYNFIFDSNTNKLGPRRLLHYGPLTKLKSAKELLGFLFNDMFILVQPMKTTSSRFNFPKNSNNNYKLYKQPILIQNLSMNLNSNENNIVTVVDESTKQSLVLSAPTVNECVTWMKNVDSAKLVYSKISELVRPKTKTRIGPSCGRLLIVVQKVQDLALTTGKFRTENVFCKVTLGDQEQKTEIAKESTVSNSVNGNPPISTFVWNHSMQFHLKNIYEDVVIFEIFELCSFNPNACLGKSELKILDIISETEKASGPVVKILILRQVLSGELLIKFDLHLFDN